MGFFEKMKANSRINNAEAKASAAPTAATTAPAVKTTAASLFKKHKPVVVAPAPAPVAKEEVKAAPAPTPAPEKKADKVDAIINKVKEKRGDEAVGVQPEKAQTEAKPDKIEEVIDLVKKEEVKEPAALAAAEEQAVSQMEGEAEAADEQFKATVNDVEPEEKKAAKPAKRKYTRKAKKATEPTPETKAEANDEFDDESSEQVAKSLSVSDYESYNVFGKKMDYSEVCKEYLTYFSEDPEWDEVRNYFDTRLADDALKFTKDVTPGAMTFLAADLVNLFDEAMAVWTQQKEMLDSIADEHTGVAMAIRALNATGASNETERRRNGFLALQNTKIASYGNRNYIAVLAMSRIRFAYMDGVTRRIKAKLDALKILASALKMEGGAVSAQA